MNAAYRELRERLAEIHDLNRRGRSSRWDQQTMMPPRGGSVRAEQLATLGRIAHEKFTSAEIGRLLDELAPFEDAQPYDSFEASLDPRHAPRLGEGAQVCPPTCARRCRALGVARVAGLGDGAAELRLRRSSCRHCETNLELRRRYIECFDGDYAEPYDVLLDDYERGHDDRRGARRVRRT